mgnify:CR=1 FL=1
MPRPIGRGARQGRTPQLVREYLSKLGDGGDNVSSIHRAVKAMLRESKPGYHWPRKHSFHALVGRLLAIGLVERTGQRDDPEGRGAGVLGTARGWRQRVWVRLAPGREDDIAWDNPMGSETGVAVAEPPPRPPGPGRPRPQPRPPATEGEAWEELSARIGQLERARQSLVQRLVAASEAPGRPEDFQGLHQAAGRFLGNVRAVWDTEQFPDAPEAMEQLGNCIRLFEMERGLTQRRVLALRNCQTWTRLLSESLASALAIPRGAPRTAPKPAPPAEATPVADAYARLIGKRANLAAGERALDQLDEQGVDVAEAHSALEEYESTTREDYDSGKTGAEDYKKDRQKAWDEFLEALKITEEPETEEEEGGS